MIYITGDIHGGIDISKLNTTLFPQQKSLTDKDFLIICGDFGCVWNHSNEEKYWRKWLDKKNFTTLFVDGNHENFQLLNQFPIIDFHGGKAHKISEKIYHLMRGQVFEIDGQLIFAMGGASSHDKEYRTENINWWKEELPTREELNFAIENLYNYDYKVDYVISHCLSTSMQNQFNDDYEQDLLTDFFQVLTEQLIYKKWYCGHYHRDYQFDEKHICLYNRVIPLGDQIL